MRHTLQTFQNRRINSVGARSLPTGRVVTAVVEQPVHLSPMGNTVAMTVGAELPFARNRRVVIHTQASGGVSRAPGYMRSRPRNGIFSGLGADMPRSTWMTRQVANDTAMGDQTGLTQSTIDEAEAIMNGDMLAVDDPAPAYTPTPAPAAAAPVTATTPAASSFDWSKVGSTLATAATTGANIYNATRPKTPVSVPTAQRAPVAKSNMTMYLIIGGVAAVGLLAFVMLRKKGSAAPAAATNPRRRR